MNRKEAIKQASKSAMREISSKSDIPKAKYNELAKKACSECPYSRGEGCSKYNDDKSLCVLLAKIKKNRIKV